MSNAPPQPRWWISQGAETKGPYTRPVIAAGLTNGTYSDSTLACLEGAEQWKTLAEWPQFASPARDSPPPTPVMANTTVEPAADGPDNVVIDTGTTRSTSPSSGPSQSSSSSFDITEIPGKVWVFAALAVIAFFGIGPLNGCVPDGCQYKSETQRRYENLQRELNR